MDGDTKSELSMVIVVFVTLILYRYIFYYSYTGTETREMSNVSCCKNPDCVRCRRYRCVQDQARRRLSWILWDLESRDPSTFSTLNRRVPDAILRSVPPRKESSRGTSHGNKNQPSSLQDPTVLMVFDLCSKEIVTDWHQDACNYLKQHQTRTIVCEALRSLGDKKICNEIDHPKQNDYQSSSSSIVPSDETDDSKWTLNDSSPEGDWRVFQILNQGVWNAVLMNDESGNNEPCRKLLELIRNIPGLMNNCLFGNVFVSKIYPGTIIEPHCGPTNIRHRLQFLLKLPDNLHLSEGQNSANQKAVLSLSVGCKESIVWDIKKDTFVFDDSFVHSVAYLDGDHNVHTNTSSKNSKKNDLRKKDCAARIVLIVDLWHPHLENVERKLVRDLYPPYTR